MKFDPTQLTPAIRPQDDFFKYVNSKWLAEHPIPESEIRWGSFSVLRDEAWKAMRDIYESLQNEDSEGVARQARDFYYAGMHYNDLEATHLTELNALLADIDAITSPTDLAETIGAFQALQLSSPWYVWVNTDHEDSNRHILHMHQGGLTLPDRDYYLDDSERMRTIRTAYKKYVNDVYDHFPNIATDAATLWEHVFTFETAIAKASKGSADLRDVKANFNKTTFANLQKTYPDVDWKRYADALGWKPSRSFSVDQPEFLTFAAQAFRTVPLTTWKHYLKWRILSRCLPKLSDRYALLAFSFFGKVLSGTKDITPLWKRVVLAADSAIGEATGQLYVERYFPESSKQQILELVEELRDAYAKRIKTLEWMSDPTKDYALKKLKNMTVLIGYPDTWRDFSDLTITRDSYLQNVLNASRFEMAYWLGRLETPTSRKDWFMNPQTVNAYHDPNRLVICFPAAILQPPFFAPDAPLPVNMGGIGTVIGHEFTHGFDDQGYQFDAEGNVSAWQTEAERTAFEKKAQIIIDQADAFEIFPDLRLNGKLVIGESIADLGGLEIALDALKQRIGDSLHSSSSESLTPAQQFFANYAFTECSATREEKERELTLTDPHPASEYRVNGILQHVDDFYKAYDLKNGDILYRTPERRARIW